MDRAAPARTLSRPARRDGALARANARQRFSFALATRDDDQDVRGLLRSSALPGPVSLSLEREPDFSIGSAIEGDVHDVIVARHRQSRRLAAMASRSVRDRFVNGRPSRVGYLGQLRIDAAFLRQRGLLDAGFEFCRGLDAAGGPGIYLASVTAGNTGGRRLLERGRPGWPRFEPADRLVSMAIPVRRSPSSPARGVELVSGAGVDPSAIAGCLWRFNQRHQFAPCWTAADLTSTTGLHGLETGDFIVAMRGGAIVGCAACWDQRAFKQVVVRGYAGPLRRWRPVINLMAPVLGHPILPPVGAALNIAYLSHVAVDDDDPAVLIALVCAGCRRARRAGLDLVAIGLSASGGLLGPVRRAFRHQSYETIIYAACWPDGDTVVSALDPRPSHPELAIL